MKPLPCIACGAELEHALGEEFRDIAGEVNQPYAGTAFYSSGHYGSTVWDRMDDEILEITVCDNCLRAAPKERLMRSVSRQPIPRNMLIGFGLDEYQYADYKPIASD